MTNDECRVLWELRREPGLFEMLEQSTGSELQIQAQLRRKIPDELVRAVLALDNLRHRAAAKFSRAAEMWFDRKGLEQATPEAVARHKAKRFAGSVWDYCCGIGGDTIALAAHCEVMAVDVSPAQTLRTVWNAEIHGVASQVQAVCADVHQLVSRVDFVHIDPDRRAGNGGRSRRVEESVPGLEFLKRLTSEFAGGAIKLSPASNFAGKFPDGELELVSLSGECKEATVWFGELASPGLWRATVLPAGATLAADPLSAQAEPGPLGGFLYDPDPAVVRAGLVDVLAEKLNLRRLDEAEEYLTSEELVHSPFVRALAVDAQLPNNEREIRRYFRAADIGQVEIKCRHIPIQADALRRRLPLEGRQAAVLVFARISGKARAVICRRLVDGENHGRFTEQRAGE
jgi:hypothetical protein